MKIILTILIIILSISNSFGQNQIFKEYVFAGGDYEIYFIDLFPQTKFFNTKYNELAQKEVSKDFYVSDSIDLCQLKQNWEFEKVNYKYECGYDYFAYLYYQNSIIEDIRINTDCNEIIFKGQAYTSSENFLINEIKSFDTLKRKTYRCNTQQECDSFLLINDSFIRDLTKSIKIHDNILNKDFFEMKIFLKE